MGMGWEGSACITTFRIDRVLGKHDEGSLRTQGYGREATGGPGAEEGRDEGEKGGGDVRDELLRASMRHVGKLGFTMQAVHAAGTDLGYSKAVANVLPGKEVDLIEYFLEDCRAKMNEELEERKEELGGMKIREKIATAVRIRLKLVAPYANVWPRAIYTMSQPPNVTSSLYNLHLLMDDMWYAAGDKSTDLNWYSKRMLLAGVYTSSELFLVQDSSQEFEETWHFVDRQISRVLKLGKAGSDILSFFKTIAEGGGGLGGSAGPGTRV
ncbi:ubiquinone biosynthesis protein [Chloropicon primus]|nr:ubiquinone biosynthesis protein [Chloropicon primus]